jgi:hypothetical protein
MQELLTAAHGQPRRAHAMDTLASRRLKDKLGGLLPQAHLDSIARSLVSALELICQRRLDCGAGDADRPPQAVLAAIREQTARRSLGSSRDNTLSPSPSPHPPLAPRERAKRGNAVSSDGPEIPT